MKKQLIVVVHGVGVREAGAATGQLSAVLSAEASRGPEECCEPEQPWKPHSTDDFLLREGHLTTTNGLYNVFPAHLRRFRRKVGGGPEDAPDQERVIADFFWGDISGTGTSPLRMIIGLVKIVLGLSHAIRENAAEAFAEDRPADRALRWLARAAALLIHGPIVAINAVLILGLSVTLGWHALNGRGFSPVQVAELGPTWTEVLTGVLAIGLGVLMLARAQVFLLRHLAGWIVVTGCAMIGIAVLQQTAPGPTMALMDFVNEYVFASSAIEPAARMPASKGFALPAALLMSGMVACWVLVFLAAWITWLACKMPGRRPVEVIVPEAILLMSMAWMLLMTTVWTVILLVNWYFDFHIGFKLPGGLSPQLVIACLRLVTPAGLGLAVLAVVGLYIHQRKARFFARGAFLPDAYLAKREALADKHRLIVGRGLLLTLEGFMMATTVLFVLSILPEAWSVPGVNFDWIRQANEDAMPYLLVAVGVMTALVVAVGRSALAAGVAIFTDVLVYLNDYSWNRRDAGSGRRRRGKIPSLAARWGWFLHRIGLNPMGQRQGYWLRGRIFARMQELVKRLVTDEDPDEIVIVSHSQGTVIALGVIETMGRSWQRPKSQPQRVIKLATMGSPYRHLYGHYFPSDFPPPDKLRTAAPLTKGGVLEDWLNIFRVDDFVGTHVGLPGPANMGAGWPRERPVAPNGHTNYWVDENVIPLLRCFLAFRPKGAPAKAP